MRMRGIVHNRCLGLGRSCQEEAERLRKEGRRSAKNKPKTFPGLDPGPQEGPISCGSGVNSGIYHLLWDKT